MTRGKTVGDEVEPTSRSMFDLTKFLSNDDITDEVEKTLDTTQFENVIKLIEVKEEVVKQNPQKVEKPKNYLACCEIRKQIVDWLMIVNSKLGKSDSTLIQAVEMLDKMIEFYDYQLGSSDMHLIAVVCYYSASKLEEVNPVSLQTLISKVCRNKFTKKDILSAEVLILTKLKYQIPRNFFLDFIEGLFLTEQFHGKTNKSTIISIAKETYKMLLLDNAFLENQNTIEKYFAIFHYSINIAEKEAINVEINRSFQHISFVTFNIINKDEFVNYIKTLKKYFSETLSSLFIIQTMRDDEETLTIN